MLGLFNLLPLLKGWEYKAHGIDRVVVRGEAPISLSLSEMGWLLGINLLSNDCYGTLRLMFQGADLQQATLTGNAESALALGAVAQDPSGWIQRYFRPNPNSTAGLFFSIVYSGGFQGSCLPYIPTVKIEVFLPETSTQTSATIQAFSQIIAITDKKAFIYSLRKILDNKASIEIDPALLAIGPSTFKGEK